MNSAMGPICNDKVTEKWNLWVHEQCTDALFTVEKSTFAATVQWTVAAYSKTRENKKRKKEKKNEMWRLQTQTQQKPNPNRHNIDRHVYAY